MQALREVGLPVSSMNDVAGLKPPFPEALPTLLRLLRLVKHESVREVIARVVAARDENEDEEWRLVSHALQQAGLTATDVDDLWRSGTPPHPEAVPVLVQMLPRVTDQHLKQAIVRALTMKEAKGFAAEALVEEFLRGNDPGLKWALGNALSIVADDRVFDKVAEMARDKAHGRSRQMMVVALGNMKNPQAVQLLIELLRDSEVAGHAIIALGKLCASQAVPHIEPFERHPLPWVQKEARRALGRMRKKG